MKIQIKSRSEIEKMAEAPFEARTALISITDHGWHFAELKHAPDMLLQIAFDDVDNDALTDACGRSPTEEERRAMEEKYKMLSDAQAAEIAAFYRGCRGSVTTLICQCEHGQSRSAAIAAAILEFRGRGGIKIFASDRYYPNKVVFRKVLAALKAQE